MPTTTRFALRYPASSDVPDVPADMQALADDVAVLLVGWSAGVFASRPAAGVSGRVYYSTDTIELWYDNGSAWSEIRLGSVGKTLALVAHHPGSLQLKAATTSDVAVDATNLQTTFTAPASGDVLAELTASWQADDGIGLNWSLWDASSGGSLVVEHDDVARPIGGTEVGSATVAMKVTGLTPAASYTWWWRHKESGSNAITRYGGDNGAAVIRVTAL